MLLTETPTPKAAAYASQAADLSCTVHTIRRVAVPGYITVSVHVTAAACTAV